MVVSAEIEEVELADATTVVCAGVGGESQGSVFGSTGSGSRRGFELGIEAELGTGFASTFELSGRLLGPGKTKSTGYNAAWRQNTYLQFRPNSNGPVSCSNLVKTKKLHEMQDNEVKGD